MNFNKALQAIVFTTILLCPLISNAKVNNKPTDSEISTSINTQLSSDSALNGTSIHAETKKGVVNLSGTVDSETQASAATLIAQSTPYVKDVDVDQLKINGSQHPIADTIITAKIKGMYIQKKLYSHEDIAAMSISVETNNGVVSLSGTAANKKQLENAIKIAKSISGVKDVKSTVTLTPITR